MQVKRISTEKLIEIEKMFRPQDFEDFIWQQEIKKILKAAIHSAQKRQSNLWHVLFSGESGYGKTTMWWIISKSLWVNIKIVTWYAITKPAELISILNSLQDWDILFIDEIHRLRANIEEILYIAMEDFAIDMVMPEWWNVRIPLNKFSLVWATTKLESLSWPLKNRFVYKFHFVDYTNHEKKDIIKRYLNLYQINFDNSLLEKIANHIISVPREINNFCIQLRDYLISKWAKESNLNLDDEIWLEFKSWANLETGWLNHIHKKYMEILNDFEWWPVWLKTISLKIWLNEKAVENDIEPLLLKLWIIDKTSKWRILKK